jgi:hypothetical protein
MILDRGSRDQLLEDYVITESIWVRVLASILIIFSAMQDFFIYI